MSRAEIVIDVAAIRHNLRALRDFVGVGMMSVVKADGYGHGLTEAAGAARDAGAEWLGVASVAEAVRLRDTGDTGRILSWLLTASEDVEGAVRRDIDVTAYSISDLDRIAAAGRAVDRRPRVQLKVDTGLYRGGVGFADWPDTVRYARKLEHDGLLRATGIWSHFSSAEVVADPSNTEQQRRFEDALAIADEAGLRPEVCHLANSAGALLHPGARYNLVRCGIAGYGIDPAPGLSPDLGLIPAMTVRTELALTKHIAAGGAVSYNHTWTATEETTLGLVPLGYADGINRHASNRAEVWITGRRRPVRGTVCMDQIVVDLDGDRPEPGAVVEIWGTGADGGPTAQDWADAAGTIPYEIVTGIGGRLTRRHIDSDQPAPTDQSRTRAEEENP